VKLINAAETEDHLTEANSTIRGVYRGIPGDEVDRVSKISGTKTKKVAGGISPVWRHN